MIVLGDFLRHFNLNCTLNNSKSSIFSVFISAFREWNEVRGGKMRKIAVLDGFLKNERFSDVFDIRFVGNESFVVGFLAVRRLVLLTSTDRSSYHSILD